MAADTKKVIDYNVHLYPIQKPHHNTVFKDEKTKEVIPNDYELLFVIGNSLDLFGVYDGDIVLVKPITVGDASKLFMNTTIANGPLCVFKNNNELVVNKIWSYKSFIEDSSQDEKVFITKLTGSSEFNLIRQDIRFTSRNSVVNNYMTNYKKMYRGGIITSLDKKNNWQLNKVDLQNIVGIITHVFTPKK